MYANRLFSKSSFFPLGLIVIVEDAGGREYLASSSLDAAEDVELWLLSSIELPLSDVERDGDGRRSSIVTVEGAVVYLVCDRCEIVQNM